MTDLDERLRAALRAEAERRPVDTAALHQRVQARLSGEPAARGRRPARTALPLVAAAAAFAAVAGTAVVVDRLGPDALLGRGPAVGGVDDRFSCPARDTTVFDADNTDDSFLPELTSGLRPAGEASRLPRYEVEELGDRVRVRFGDVDGSLASVVVFRPGADGYEPVTVEKCTNGTSPRGPVVDPETQPAASAGQLTEEDLAPGAVKLMDTVTYDVAGLAVRRSVWGVPFGRTASLLAGTDTSTIQGRLRRGEVEPTDATAFLYGPDNIVGLRTGHRLIVCYDSGNDLRAVTWSTRSGRTTEVTAVRGGWPGQLFAMVVPTDEVDVVTTHLRRGPAKDWPADEIRR